MSKVIKSELESANALLNSFNDITSTMNSLTKAIHSFSSKTNDYKGAGYDAARARMSTYVDAISKYIQLVDILKTNTVSANGFMSNFMDVYTYLDTSELEEFISQYNSLSYKIECAKSQISSFSNDSNKDQLKGVYTTIYYCEQQQADLKKKILKLKNLDGADSSAYSNISCVESDVNNFINAVNNIDRGVFVSKK